MACPRAIAAEGEREAMNDRDEHEERFKNLIKQLCPDCGYVNDPVCVQCKRRFDRQVAEQAERGTLGFHYEEHVRAFGSYRTARGKGGGQCELGGSSDG